MLHTAGMVERLCYSTRIYKILCSNLSIIIHEMILDKSLATKLSRMADSSSVNVSSVSTLDGRGGAITFRQKENDSRNWLYVDPNNNRSRS